MVGRRFMFHDVRGVRGPYIAHRTDSPTYFCMVPEGLEIPGDSPIFQQGGFVGLKELMRDHRETLHQVGWASVRSLREGLRPGLKGEVGWTPVDAS